jgi:hypothetical protein
MHLLAEALITSTIKRMAVCTTRDIKYLQKQEGEGVRKRRGDVVCTG